MKRVFAFILLIMLVVINSVACAQTKSFYATGERHSNGVNSSSAAKKSNDGDKYFYVTIDRVWGLNDADKIYFGPRRKTSSGYSGALSDGLGYWLGRNTRQKRKYTKSAPGGQTYCLNVKQHPDGPGSWFGLDVIWTP